MITKKEIAIECLEKLDIYKPYINKFKSNDIPCFFENFGGFYVDQEPEIYEKVKEVESKHDCLVYALTHEFCEFGETWSMLCVPRDVESIDDCLMAYINNTDYNSYYAFSYVWNKTEELFSEFGDVVVTCLGGGIKRIG